MRRLALALTLLLCWGAFGYGVNRLLASRKSVGEAAAPVAPPQATPLFALPGSIFLSQGGHLYRMRGGQTGDLGLPGSAGSWMQPSPAGGSRLLVVARAQEYSDVWLVDGVSGRPLRQLTDNRTRTRRPELNAWSFWPHLASDGTTVVSSYDGPKTGLSYQVDFAVWSGPISGRLASRRWTSPNPYTGGDTAPVPLPGGGIIFARYQLTPDGKLVSRLVVMARPGAAPTFLTSAADDCSQPAVSPDGTRVATICTADSQSATLRVLMLDSGTSLPAAPTPRSTPQAGIATATPRPLQLTLAAGCLCAGPTWSPDGSGLLYLAPADATGHFQLWWVDRAATSTPAAPRQITTNLDLDATSPPAWLPG